MDICGHFNMYVLNACAKTTYANCPALTIYSRVHTKAFLYLLRLIIIVLSNNHGAVTTLHMSGCHDIVPCSWASAVVRCHASQCAVGITK